MTPGIADITTTFRDADSVASRAEPPSPPGHSRRGPRRCTRRWRSGSPRDRWCHAATVNAGGETLLSTGHRAELKPSLGRLGHE
jgi:hypothetical protein